MPSLSSAVVLFFLSKQRETFQNLLILPLGENRRQEESFCDEWQQRWCPGLLLAPPGCQRGSPPPWSPSFMRKHKLGAMLEARGQVGPHVKQHKQHCDSWSERQLSCLPLTFFPLVSASQTFLAELGGNPGKMGPEGSAEGRLEAPTQPPRGTPTPMSPREEPASVWGPCVCPLNWSQGKWVAHWTWPAHGKGRTSLSSEAE